LHIPQFALGSIAACASLAIRCIFAPELADPDELFAGAKDARRHNSSVTRREAV